MLLKAQLSILQFLKQPGGQSDIVWCYSGLKWMQLKKFQVKIQSLDS